MSRTEINIENPTISIDVAEGPRSRDASNLLKYQFELGLLWFLSFTIEACRLDTRNNLYNFIDKNSLTNYFKEPTNILNLLSHIVSKICPVQGFTLSCGEATMGTFSGAINNLILGAGAQRSNIIAKILALYLIGITYSRAISRAGFCYMHTTMVKNSTYDFYYKVLAQFNLALVEVSYPNTNTSNTLSSVTYLTHDIADKVVNGKLDLEELFLLPDFTTHKDSNPYLFKDIKHVQEHLKL